MQKVYLLLRNNQQTGPYSLEELIKFDLKAYDLIWIEGKSAGWYYPQEIKALQPHLSFVKQMPAEQTAKMVQPSFEKATLLSQPKKIFVSMPVDTKSKQTPQSLSTNTAAVATAAPKLSVPSSPPKEAEEIKTSYTKDLKDVETDCMNWVYQKKTQKQSVASVRGAIAACLVVSLAFAAWWIMKPAGEATKSVSTEQSSFTPVQSELAVDSAMEDETVAPVKKTAFKKDKTKQTAVAATNMTTVEKLQPIKKNVEGTTVIPNLTESHDYESAPVVKEESKTAAEEKKEQVIEEAPKEKKKLRDKIFDLFKKKPAEKTEDAKPVEEENGKRNSTRRESVSNLSQMVAVRLTIPNEWMMGIKGAKAILTNRGSEVIVKAVVEVVYYNDDNDVVDRKSIFFADIKSKQTKTVAVPDHSIATRLEYNVISAVGASEPFAKR